MKFEKFLETVSIKDHEKKVLISLRKNLTNLQNYNCKKVWINGSRGTGKTELVKRLLSDTKIPIIYFGLEAEKGYINCKDTSEVLETAEKHKKCVVFIDNASTVMESQQCGGGWKVEDKKNLFKLFNHVNKSQNKIAIIVTHFIDSDGLIDRLDAQIGLDLPSKKTKIKFIQRNYPSLLKRDCINYLSAKTIGYTFRDIDGIIKILRSSNKSVSNQEIDKTLRCYTPSALDGYKVTHVTDLDFNNVVGRKAIKEQLRRALISIKYKELASKLSINVKNLLFFYGEPGTGKTFMAKAIAGELGMPIISINASDIVRHGDSPFRFLRQVINLGIRFGDSILLFDEAEKIFGRNVLGEDAQLQGDLQGYLDGVGKKMKSLVIFTLNEQAQFGAPLKDRFLMFKFDKPGTEERTEFLKRKYDFAKSHFSIKIDVKALSEMIGEKSFREIEKIWDQTLLDKLITKDKTISQKDFEKTIKLMQTKKENVICG